MQDSDAKLDELIAEYLLQAESGEVPNRDSFLNNNPEYRKDLESFFDDYERMRRIAKIGTSTIRLAQTANSTAIDFAGAEPGSVPITKSDFGDYELLNEIARGGMGIVFRARQKSLNRIVALKMILRGGFASHDETERFLSEARAAGRLDHPGIVPIFDVGSHKGQYFYSMGFVDGPSLASRLIDGPLEQSESVRVLIALANAVQAAHDGGIIHRDLKPGNVLLDENQTPKITDFGLARSHDDTAGLTVTGQILGTPAYMAPEQATGSPAEHTKLVDVYSLGAILYCMLTGRAPFQAASPIETVRQVLEHDAVAPSQLNPNVDRDVETICLKCLEKEPKRRLASAREIADELTRWQNKEPIHSRRIGPAGRLGRWCNRNPAVASLAGILAAAIFVIGILTPGYLSRKYRLQQQSAEIRAQALSSLDRANTFLGDPQSVRLGDMRIPKRELEQVDKLLSVSSTPDLQSQAKSLRKNIKLITQLEEARRIRSTSNAGVRNTMNSCEGYRTALEAWLEFEPLQDVPKSGKIISESVIAERIVSGLDDWSIAMTDTLNRDDNAEAASQFKRLQQLINVGDPSPTKVESAVRSLNEETSEKVDEVLNVVNDAAGDSYLAPEVFIRLAQWLDDKQKRTLYRNALSRTPNDFWLNFEMANANEQISEEDALSYYMVARSLRPESAFATQSLADFYVRNRRLDEALEMFSRAAELDPKNVYSEFCQIATLLSLNRKKDAKTFTEKLERESPDDVLCWVAKSLIQYADQDLKQCEADLKRAIQIDPENIQARIQLGLIYQDQRAFELAEKSYSKAYEINPEYHELAARYAGILARLGKVQRAQEMLEKAVAINPRDGHAWYYFGVHYAVTRQPAKAIPCYLKALELNYTGPTIEFNLANVLKDTNDLSGAVVHYRRALSQNPRIADAHVNLAIALKRQGKLPDAILHYRKAIEIQPDIPDAWYNLGIACREWGDYSQAVDAFDKAIEQFKTDYQAISNQAITYQVMWDYDKALDGMNAALKIKPDYALGLFRKAQLLLFSGEFQEAGDVFRKSHELGNSSRSWDQPAVELSRVSDRLAKLQDQIEDVLEAKTEGLNVDELQDRILFCYRRGKLEQAVIYLQRLRELSPKSVGEMYLTASACLIKAADQTGERETEKNSGQPSKATQLRKLALDLLKRDLAKVTIYRADHRMSDSMLRKHLAAWLWHPDYATVRDADAIAKLPKSEQEEWTEFWAGVRVLFDEPERKGKR